MVSQVEQTKTNLLIQMEVLARWLAVIVVIISLGTFLLAWFRGGHGPGSAFQTAVAVAVAMIPAGLPALTTIVLAVSGSCWAGQRVRAACLGAAVTGLVSPVGPVFALGLS
jgi:Ca2+-transporting ATPase